MARQSKKQTFKNRLPEINALLDPDEWLTESSLSKLRREGGGTNGSPRQRAAVTAILGKDAGGACDWEALSHIEREWLETKDLIIAKKDADILARDQEIIRWRGLMPREHWICNVKGTLILSLVCLALITWGFWRPAMTLMAVKASDGLLHRMAEQYDENLRLKRIIDDLRPVVKELKTQVKETEDRLKGDGGK